MVSHRRQTDRTVKSWPLTKLADEGLQRLHSADGNAVSYFDMLCALTIVKAERR